MTTDSLLNILLSSRGWKLLGYFAFSNEAIIERGHQRQRIALPDPWLERRDANRWTEVFLDSLDRVEAELVDREADKSWSPYP